MNYHLLSCCFVTVYLRYLLRSMRLFLFYGATNVQFFVVFCIVLVACLCFMCCVQYCHYLFVVYYWLLFRIFLTFILPHKRIDLLFPRYNIKVYWYYNDTKYRTCEVLYSANKVFCVLVKFQYYKGTMWYTCFVRLYFINDYHGEFHLCKSDK